jgi:hypothetical protein
LPYAVGLIEIGRHQLGWQNIDLTPLSEQPRDARSFLVEGEF